MTHVTRRLTAKNRDQLRNPTFGSRVWLPFYNMHATAVTILTTVVQWRIRDFKSVGLIGEVRGAVKNPANDGLRELDFVCRQAGAFYF